MEEKKKYQLVKSGAEKDRLKRVAELKSLANYPKKKKFGLFFSNGEG